MKISELINILEGCKHDCGDREVILEVRRDIENDLEGDEGYDCYDFIACASFTELVREGNTLVLLAQEIAKPDFIP